MQIRDIHSPPPCLWAGGRGFVVSYCKGDVFWGNNRQAETELLAKMFCIKCKTKQHTFVTFAAPFENYQIRDPLKQGVQRKACWVALRAGEFGHCISEFCS